MRHLFFQCLDGPCGTTLSPQETTETSCCSFAVRSPIPCATANKYPSEFFSLFSKAVRASAQHSHASAVCFLHLLCKLRGSSFPYTQLPKTQCSCSRPPVRFPLSSSLSTPSTLLSCFPATSLSTRARFSEISLWLPEINRERLCTILMYSLLARRFSSECFEDLHVPTHFVVHVFFSSFSCPCLEDKTGFSALFAVGAPSSLNQQSFFD